MRALARAALWRRAGGAGLGHSPPRPPARPPRGAEATAKPAPARNRHAAKSLPAPISKSPHHPARRQAARATHRPASGADRGGKSRGAAGETGGRDRSARHRRRVGGTVQSIGAEFIDIVAIARAAPKAAAWVEAQTSSPQARLLWLGALWRLFIVFLAAASIAALFARALRPVRRRVALRRGDHFLRWLLLFVTTSILALVPIAVFAAVATIFLALLHPAAPARPMAAVAIAAICGRRCRWRRPGYAAVAGLSVFPAARRGSRTYLYIWVRRFILWGIYGFAAAQFVLVIGAHHSIADQILRLTTIVLAGLVHRLCAPGAATMSARSCAGRRIAPRRRPAHSA